MNVTLSPHARQRCRERGVSERRLSSCLDDPSIVGIVTRYAPLRVALRGVLPKGQIPVVRYTGQIEVITILSARHLTNPWTPIVEVPHA